MALTTLKPGGIHSDLVTAVSGSVTAVSSSLASRLTTEEVEAEGTVVSSSAQIATDISGSITSVSSSLASRIDTKGTDMTLATASIATNESNMTLATASIAAITASVSTLKSNVGQALNTDSAVTFATVDTGQGANELYDMDQNVKTDSSPTFAAATITGTLTATEVHTQFVSASITKTTGSNVFGDEPSDRHQFTGSAFISSSITAVTGSYGRVEATNYTGDGSALTGIDIPTAAAISGAAAITSIAGAAANQILTDDGDTTVTSESNLTYDGTTFTVDDDLTIGADDAGHDVIFYGHTAGKKVHYDASTNELEVTGTLNDGQDTSSYINFNYCNGTISHVSMRVLASIANNSTMDLSAQNLAGGYILITGYYGYWGYATGLLALRATDNDPALLAQINFTTTADNAGTLNVYRLGGSGNVTLQNKLGGTFTPRILYGGG